MSLNTNAIIISYVGKITEKSFDLIDFSKKYVEPEGVAYNEVEVKGSKQKGVVKINFNKKDNVWCIAKMDLLIGKNIIVNIIKAPIKIESIDANIF